MQRKFASYSEALEYVEKNEAIFKMLYIKKDMTAKKVAENQNIAFDNNFQKALLRVCGKKGMGLGGARVGAGQKKKKIEKKVKNNSYQIWYIEINHLSLYYQTGRQTGNFFKPFKFLNDAQFKIYPRRHN